MSPKAHRPPSCSRRGALGLLAAGTALAILPPVPSAALPEASALDFRILRKGSEIGGHRVRFARHDGDRLEVVTEIEVEVQLAFVTLYSFRQRVAQLWVGDRMQEAEIRIEDQGEVREFAVVGRDGVLELDFGGTRRILPPDCLTDIDFWNPAITRRTRVLDTWSGELVPIATEPGPVETVDLGALAVPARRFHLRANRGRSGLVWYTDDGIWVRGRLVTRGESLDYLPRSVAALAQSGQT